MERRTLLRQRILMCIEESLILKQLKMNKCICTFPQTAASGTNTFTFGAVSVCGIKNEGL